MIQAEWLLLGSKTATIYLRAGYVRHRLRKHLNDLKCTKFDIYVERALCIYADLRRNVPCVFVTLWGEVLMPPCVSIFDISTHRRSWSTKKYEAEIIIVIYCANRGFLTPLA